MHKILSVSQLTGINPNRSAFCDEHVLAERYEHDESPWLYMGSVMHSVPIRRYLSSGYKEDEATIRAVVRCIETLDLDHPIMRDTNLDLYIMAACQNKWFQNRDWALNAVQILSWLQQFTHKQSLSTMDKWLKWPLDTGMVKLAEPNLVMSQEAYITSVILNCHERNVVFVNGSRQDMIDAFMALPPAEKFLLPVQSYAPPKLTLSSLCEMNVPLKKMPTVIDIDGMVYYPSAAIVSLLNHFAVSPNPTIRGCVAFGVVTPSMFQQLRLQGLHPVSGYSKHLENLIAPHDRICGPFLATWHDQYHLGLLNIAPFQLDFVMKGLLPALQQLARPNSALAHSIDLIVERVMDLDYESGYGGEKFRTTPFTFDFYEIMSTALNPPSDVDATQDEYAQANVYEYVLIEALFMANRARWYRDFRVDVDYIDLFSTIERYPQGIRIKDKWYGVAKEVVSILEADDAQEWSQGAAHRALIEVMDKKTPAEKEQLHGKFEPPLSASGPSKTKQAARHFSTWARPNTMSPSSPIAEHAPVFHYNFGFLNTFFKGSPMNRAQTAMPTAGIARATPGTIAARPMLTAATPISATHIAETRIEATRIAAATARATAVATPIPTAATARTTPGIRRFASATLRMARRLFF